MNTPPPTELPRANIKKKSRFSLIWVIPALAALAAAWLVFADLRQNGPLITIWFADGSGLQASQTIVKYHGVRVGEVRSIQLSKDLQRVEVTVRLQHSAAGLAREGSQFWVVKPEVSSAGLHGLETIVSGPFIQAQPGSGKAQKEFAGMAEPPVSASFNGKYEVIVTTPQINTLSAGSPVYYRGVQVGEVSYFVFSNDARTINVHLLLETNYAPLVRTNTKFWNAGGINFRLKFLGLSASAENFKSLIVGGLAFATPDDLGPPAPSGTVFALYERSEADWLKWSPAIAITNFPTAGEGNTPPAALLNDMDSADK